MHPVLFKVGSFEMPTFGVFMVAAFFGGLWLAQRRAPSRGLKPEAISDGGLWALLGGILGARIFFIAQEWGYYSTHLHELFSLRFQGLTSFGGLIVGALGLILWARRSRTPIAPVLDVVAPAFLVGHIVGRFGCLFNGCCFGGVCPPTVPWAIRVAGDAGHLHHPAQIYDALLNAAALTAVLLYDRRANRPTGTVVGLVLALHGLTRFVYEFWRAGTVDQVARGEASSTYWGSLPITQAQAMAAALSAVGFAIFVASSGRKTGVRPTAVASVSDR